MPITKEVIVLYTDDGMGNSIGEIVGEVVRCKDCKHREVQVDGVFRYEMCGMRNEIINLEGFCHMGERREDAKEE